MDGIIIIDKQKEWTSHDVVSKVKRIFKEKVGHTGTLDPNATGVLPLLIGKGTLASKYLINHDKIYEVILKLGEKTETADIEGNVIETKDVDEKIFKEEYLKNILNQFLGKQQQIPPIYSAIKVNGKKLYEYARKNQKVEIEPRNIEIYNIELVNFDKENNEIQFRVSCSKGTYIRSLCEDIATKLETVGYMKDLRRTKVGDFTLENAIIIEELEENFHNQEFINKYFISLEKLFENNEKLILEDKKLGLFLNGVNLTYKLEDRVYNIYNSQNKYIGTGTIKNNLLKRDIIV